MFFSKSNFQMVNIMKFKTFQIAYKQR